MSNDIVIKGTADVEVVKHRIYEVRAMDLKSQIVTSNLEMANIESDAQFAVKNFDCKTMMETKQEAKMAAQK